MLEILHIHKMVLQRGKLEKKINLKTGITIFLNTYQNRVHLPVSIAIFQFLEKLAEKVQKGIEEANKELHKEMDEKLMQEVGHWYTLN